MSAFVTAMVTVKNPEKFQQYAQQAGATFAAYGGEVLIKGKPLDGGWVEAHDAIAIIRFPSIEHIDQWYGSPEYQALIPLRDEGADIAFNRYAA